MYYRASVLSISDSRCFWGTTHFVMAAQSGRDRAHKQPLSRTSGVRFWRAFFCRIRSRKRADYSSCSTASWSRSIRSRWRTVRTGLLLATNIHVSVALVNSRSRCISNCSSAKSSREGNDTVLDDCRAWTSLAVALHRSTSRSLNCPVSTRVVLVTNRLCRLVPQAWLALLVCFVDANLVNAGYQNKVRERQHRRLEAGDRNDFEFSVAMTAVTEMDVRRAVDVICDYLNSDDDRVAAAAESLRFPEFEYIDPAI